MKSKLPIIIKREYLNIVKKTSFIVITLLGPIILASIFVIPIYISHINEAQISVGVIDETELLHSQEWEDHSEAEHYLFSQPER
mgnify:CR=1 FL=1